MGFLGLTVVLCLAAPSRSPGESSERVPTTLETTFVTASKLYAASQYAQAVVLFEEVYRLRPHPNVMFNIARCYEKLGVSNRALKSYREYLRLVENPPDKAVVSEAIANLERRLRETGVQQVTVFAEPKEARIEVDEKDVGPSPATVELARGNHAIRVSAAGFEPEIRSFEVSLTHASEVTVTLEAAEPGEEAMPEVAATIAPTLATSSRPPRAGAGNPELRTAAWVVLGTGLAVAVVGGVLLGLARVDYGLLSTGPGPVTSEAADRAVRDGKILQPLGWVGLGTGLVATAAGGLLAYLSRESPLVTAFVGPGGSFWLGLGGRFR